MSANEVIQEIKRRLNISDVISKHVALKKRGKNLLGLCPFHHEKTPSFNVNPTEGYYKCFGCGAGGDVFTFLQELTGRTFPEILEELAEEAGVELPKQQKMSEAELAHLKSQREKYTVMDAAQKFFTTLLHSPKGQRGHKYLFEERKMSQDVVKIFGLGYGGHFGDPPIAKYFEQEKVSLPIGVDLGVMRQGESKHYGAYENRVTFPIHHTNGRIIGFGGRYIEPERPQSPKYINSPETPLYKKTESLFNFYRTLPHLKNGYPAVLVEGYFDVIALHASGITNAVASLGTALSSQQITQLCRVSDGKRIVLNFDADGAGVRAANRAIGEVEQLALQGQLELRVLHLPSGKDPDEFLKDHGAGDYRALLDQAPLWLDWQIEQALAERDLSRADQFQQAVAALVDLLGKLPQSAVRTHYLQRVAERLSGGQGRLALQLEEDLRQQVKGQRWHGRSSRHEQPGDTSQRERCEADLLRLYLHCPRHRPTIRQELRQRELEDFAIPHHRHLWAALTELEESNIGEGRLEAISRGDESGEGLDNLDLPRLLTDQLLLENSALVSRLTPLLEPGELQRLALAEPLEQLRGITALLERQKSLKRCRHLLEAWGGQRLQTLESCIALLIEQSASADTDPDAGTDMEVRIQTLFDNLNSDALRYQELYYSERKHILHLDEQRRGGFGKVA